LQFAPISPCEDPDEIPLGDDANHASASFADRHRANAVLVHELRYSSQAGVWQAHYKPLTRVLEKLTNLHTVPPEFSSCASVHSQCVK
jgi:hypothetical protein